MKYREDGEFVKTTIRLKPEIKQTLERYAIMTDRSMSLCVEQIIKKHLEENGLMGGNN